LHGSCIISHRLWKKVKYGTLDYRNKAFFSKTSLVTPKRGITTRWSGRAKDLGVDAKVACRRSAKPLYSFSYR